MPVQDGCLEIPSGSQANSLHCVRSTKGARHANHQGQVSQANRGLGWSLPSLHQLPPSITPASSLVDRGPGAEGYQIPQRKSLDLLEWANSVPSTKRKKLLYLMPVFNFWCPKGWLIQKAPAQLCKLNGRQLTSWLSPNLLQAHCFLCKLWPQHLPSRHTWVVRLPIFTGVLGEALSWSPQCACLPGHSTPPCCFHEVPFDGRSSELYINVDVGSSLSDLLV